MRPTSNPDGAKREWAVILCLTLLGGVIRLWGLGTLGLTHFDEGVYALAGLWPFTPGGLNRLDPSVVPYAPPGFPFLVGLAYSLLGVSDTAAILPSILLGTLTIPAGAWLARRTLGPGAGAASAAFLALSLAHVSFSRKALTDAPLGLVWLVVMLAGARMLERPGVVRAVILGALVGLAQNVKYNGWVTGTIVVLAGVSGVAGGWLRRDEPATSQPPWYRSLAYWSLSVGVAASLYLPWYSFVESHGGYSGLLAHHRSYVGGVDHWLPNLKQQLQQVASLSGGPVWSLMTWGVAVLAVLLSRPGSSAGIGGSVTTVLQRMAPLFCATLAFVLIPTLPWWLGFLACSTCLSVGSPGARVLACWWLILSVLTPFYHPYARLWLPLHLVGSLLCAGFLLSILRMPVLELNSHVGTTGSNKNWDRRAIGFLIILPFALLMQWRNPVRPWPVHSHFQGTSSIRSLASEVTELEQRKGLKNRGWLILARRPVAFYLMLNGQISFSLAPDLESIIENTTRWGIVDEAVTPIEPGTEEAARIQTTLDSTLDPLTWLDVDPGTARVGRPTRLNRLLILVPKASLRDER